MPVSLISLSKSLSLIWFSSVDDKAIDLDELPCEFCKSTWDFTGPALPLLKVYDKGLYFNTLGTFIYQWNNKLIPQK